MTNPGSHFDGETTPPTNYDGETTPPTAYAASSQQPPNSSKDSNRSKLIGILATLVVVLLVLIGVLLFMFNGRDNEESAAANGSATTQQPELTSEQDDSNYAPPTPGSGDFQYPAEHLAVRGMDTNGALQVRSAFINAIAEAAEDPASPDVMPSEFTGISAGPLGDFTCKVQQSTEPGQEDYWTWDCRGPDGLQVLFYPILMGGLGDEGANDMVPSLMAKGSPADPNWKDRAIEARNQSRQGAQ